MNSETINIIRKTASERLDQLTEYCSYRDGYPIQIHQLFYLYTLIASRSLARYYDEFGYTEISLDDVIEAKKLFNYGPVSKFEATCIAELNEYLARRDKETKLLPMHYKGVNPHGLAVNTR